MAKLSKKQPNPSEDEIIAQGLAIIQDGIKSGSTEMVVKGFNSIVGSNLSWPQKSQSRLEKIRSLVNIEKDEDNEDKDEKEDDDDDDDDKSEEISVEVATQKGGTRFGDRMGGNIQVISDTFDPEVAKTNKKIAKKTLKIKRDQPKPLDQNFTNPEGDFHLDLKTNRRPPGRD